MGAPVLTKQQVAQTGRWYAKGLTVDEVFQKAIAAGWKVSRAKIGQLKPQAGAIPPPSEAPSLEDLQERLVRLEQRLQAIQQLPQQGLLESALAAVATCQHLSQDPAVPDKVRAEALGRMPALLRIATELQGEGDEELGE